MCISLCCYYNYFTQSHSNILPTNLLGPDLVKDLVFVLRTMESHRKYCFANHLNPQRGILATEDESREQDGQERGASPGRGIAVKAGPREDSMGAPRISRAHEIHTTEGSRCLGQAAG